jgi:hypothetical protein
MKETTKDLEVTTSVYWNLVPYKLGSREAEQGQSL